MANNQLGTTSPGDIPPHVTLTRFHPMALVTVEGLELRAQEQLH